MAIWPVSVRIAAGEREGGEKKKKKKIEKSTRQLFFYFFGFVFCEAQPMAKTKKQEEGKAAAAPAPDAGQATAVQADTPAAPADATVAVPAASAAPTAPATAAAAAEPAPAAGGGWGTMLFRLALFYFVYTTFINPAQRNGAAMPPSSDVALGETAGSQEPGAGGAVNTVRHAHRNLWSPLTPHSLTVYMSTEPILRWAGVKALAAGSSSGGGEGEGEGNGSKGGVVARGRERWESDAREGPVFRPLNAYTAWHEEALSYGVEPLCTRAKNVTLSVETTEGSGLDMNLVLRGNASLYAHVMLVRSGTDGSPLSPRYRPESVVYAVHSMTRFLPRPKRVDRVNLLSGEAEAVDKLADVEDHRSDEWIPFFNPRLNVRPVADHTRYAWGSIPPQVSNKLRFDERGNYWPVLYFNEFWSMREDLIPVNDTLTSLQLEMATEPISMFKWQIFEQMTASWEVQQTSFGSTASEIDEFKRMLRDTNPYYLGLTFTVSLLHSVMEMLAFKNDVSFWSSRGKDNIRGLSVRTLGISLVMQLIILLYLLDNNTSFVVLMGSFVGVLIEAWKITRACKVSASRRFPFVHFEDRFPQSMSETKKYDQEAIRYVSYVIWPLLACYTIYSLIYSSHKRYSDGGDKKKKSLCFFFFFFCVAHEYNFYLK
jgi:hypothetical protein